MPLIKSICGKDFFVTQWTIKDKKTVDWDIVPLRSSVEDETACACCGKGLVSARPVVFLSFESTSGDGSVRDQWVCVFCLQLFVKSFDIDSVIRTRYRREYNEKYLGNLTKQVSESCSLLPIHKKYLSFIHANQSVPPYILKRTREIVNERKKSRNNVS